jgi:hypothetical protein
MKVIVVGISGLATHFCEPRYGRRSDAVCPSVAEQERSQVLSHEDVLKLRLVVFDERLQEQPRPGDVELQTDVVGRVRQVPEVHACPVPVEERAYAGDGLSVRPELVEQYIDVTAALVRAMMGNRAPLLPAEVVDRHRQATQLPVDAISGVDEATDHL